MSEVPDRRTPDREQIRPVKRRVEDRLIALPGVVGVDIGEKVSRGEPTGSESIVVHVNHKVDVSQLPEDQLIPAEIDGIPTDVVEHRIRLQSHLVPVAGSAAPPTPGADTTDARRYRPLAGGASMGPFRPVPRGASAVDGAPGEYLVAGTLGAFVTDRRTGRTLALTNFHVAAVDTGWRAGDLQLQPSRIDDGAMAGSPIGTVQRAVVSDRVDGAAVLLSPGMQWYPGVIGIGPVKGRAVARIGQTVRKRGRTTGLRHGTVSSVDFTVQIDFGGETGVRTLRDQVRIDRDPTETEFSARGDSGSVVVDDRGRVVGLLFAGEEDGSFALANPIDAVLA
ncbi:MAG: peptidase S32, partial [Cellulomonas sp.]|nr:peptidase S32 [Cellulomonas sp.]